MKKLLILLLFCTLPLTACQSKNEESSTIKTPETAAPVDPQHADSAAKTPETATDTASTQTPEPTVEEQSPPTPPLTENFQGAPQLSLFPRAGAYRPEDDDTNGLQFWRTYIEHLLRTSGPLKESDQSDNVKFGFRSIKGIDSVGIFSPIAVKPATRYQVSALFSCDLVEGASAGIGVLEFDEFQWIGEQFSESMAREHQLGSQSGIRLTGKVENQPQRFDFTTGAETGMIHLVFFRDGTQDRNPVLIDDIHIEELPAN